MYHGARAEGGGSGRSVSRRPRPADGTRADWLVDLVASPAKALAKGSAADVRAPTSAPLTTKALKEAWRASGAPFEKSTATFARDGGRDVELATDFAKKQAAFLSARLLEQFLWVLKRQYQITIRNKLFMTARVGAAVMTSLILGSVWFDLPAERGFEKLGMLLCAPPSRFRTWRRADAAAEVRRAKHLDRRVPRGGVHRGVVRRARCPSRSWRPPCSRACSIPRRRARPSAAASTSTGPGQHRRVLLPHRRARRARSQRRRRSPDRSSRCSSSVAPVRDHPGQDGRAQVVYYISLSDASRSRWVCQRRERAAGGRGRGARAGEYLAQNRTDRTRRSRRCARSGAFPCTTMGKAIMAQIQIDDDTRRRCGGGAAEREEEICSTEALETGQDPDRDERRVQPSRHGRRDRARGWRDRDRD